MWSRVMTAESVAAVFAVAAFAVLVVLILRTGKGGG